MLLRQLFEQSNKTAVVAFGRMNPPTIGHLKLINKMKSIPGDHLLFLSHSQDPKQNPLSFQEKQMFASKFFPGVIVGNEHVKTPMHMMSFLEQQGYTDIIYVAGSDRVPEFDKLLNTYNGKLYNFNSINVINAGERDPDADGAEGMSASKMRAAVAADDYESFRQGVPDQSLARQMFDAVKAGMAAPVKKPARKKPPTSLSESFNSTFMALVENADISGTFTAKKPGLGFQSYATQHIAPRAAREDSSKKKSSSKYVDSELERDIEYAKHHYTGYDDDPQMAFNKYIDRALLANKKTDKSQEDQLKYLKNQISALKDKLEQVSNTPSSDLRESMLPKSAFAGSDKNKLGPAAQLKGKMKRPAKQGDLVGGMEEAVQGVAHAPATIDKISNSVNAWRNDEKEIGQLATQGHTVKFYPDRMEIYRGADLVVTKPGDFNSIQNKHIVAAKTVVGNLIRNQRSSTKESKSKAISKTAKDLSNPPKIMQHRAKRDQERDRHYAGSQLAKRDTTSKDEWGDYKEDWQKVNKSDKTDGMSKKAVKAYRRENPGSKLKTAVTTKPSKLTKGSKDAKRRSSFCARMSGMKKSRASAETKRDPNSPINKALRRWNCKESVNQNTSLYENIENIMSSLIEKILKNNKD